MKNLIITLLSVLALSITFTGCGDSAGSISGANEGNQLSDSEIIKEDVPVVVDEAEQVTTTPKTPHNISSLLGTPPGLPTE